MPVDVSHAVAPRYVPGTADNWTNPWPMYAALRDHDPVHHVVPEYTPDQDYYVLTRHADVYEAARDWETFSSARGLTVTYGDLEKTGMGDNPPMVMQDPPTHTEFRKLVSRGFTPRQVIAVEPKVREFVVQRLERLKERGEGDIVVELFKPLPSMVVAHYLGVPEEDRTQFDAWTDGIVAAASGGAIDIEAMQGEVAQTIGELMMYFTGLIERRRAEPEDDTVSHLVAAGVGADGDISGTLQILGFAFTMVTGGNDTTTGMLGGAIQLLHQNPAQRRKLIDDPSLIPGAVEEFLRLTSPVQGLARTATRDVIIGDTTIPAGVAHCCSTAVPTEMNVNTAMTQPNWMSYGSRATFSPSATGTTTAWELPPHACNRGLLSRNYSPAYQISRSISTESPGRTARTCEGP